ncbi:MAG: flagellar filament capping protein FliD [Porticoccaceae bacterium]|nr:flagellar filament capping protein FliD [Porticoccaceae bacterium]
MTDVSSTAATGSSISSTIFTSLDVGSGLDSPKLALDLTNAEKMPRQNAINADIKASEAAVSGYALVSADVKLLQTAFEALNDADELTKGTGTTTDSTKVSFSSVTGSAAPGSYNFTVSQLAQNQRTVSDQFASATTSINSGTAFDLSLSVGGTQKGTYEQALSEASLRAALNNSGSINLSDGTNSFSISQAQVNSAGGTSAGAETLAGYVAAIEANKPGGFQFAFAVNGTEGVKFTQSTAGTGVLTSGSGVVTAGVASVTPVTGVAAVHRSALTASVTGTLAVSDGTNSISVASATYASVAAQVTAIQAAAGYDDLLFTVAANGDNMDMTYKTTGAISTAPTVTIDGTSKTVTRPTAGVTAVNSAVVTRVPINTTTPSGVVTAINEANKGVTATLVDTGGDGTNYRIMLSGTSGLDSAFSVTSSISDDLGFGDAEKTLQAAQDSIINYDGLNITRSSNQVSDVIAGATISLNNTTGSSVRLTITSDTSTLKTNLKTVVTVYNNLQDLFSNLGSVDESSTDSMNGALARDSSMINQLKSKIRSAIFADSGTKSGAITGLRDLGISLSQTGDMTFNDTKYFDAIASDYSDVVTMLTANTNNQSLFDTSEKGLSQDVATSLKELTDTNGLITTRSKNADATVLDHKTELVKLEERMDAVYQRYLSQFAAMETIMASMEGTKDYLKGQLESLSKAYDNN